MKHARLLHTMLRVADLDASLDFYVRVLGMDLLRRQNFPEGRFTLAFFGFQPERSGAVIELTHNWDKSQYDRGDVYGHLAIGTDNIHAFAEAIGTRSVEREAAQSHSFVDRSAKLISPPSVALLGSKLSFGH